MVSSTIFNQTLIMLILIAIGVICAKTKLISEASNKDLSKFVLQVVNPVVIFMSYSSLMCIVWIMMESPDLAITEAAVGAGISGVLFMLTLKKIRAVDAGEVPGEDMEGEGLDEQSDQ